MKEKKSILFTTTAYSKKYLLTHPWEIIANFFRDIKCAWQRANYGYCFRDIWCIDWWFLEIIPKMLQDLNKVRSTHPVNMTDKEWGNILDEMTFYFTEASEETCTQENNLDINDPNWINRESQLQEYRQECSKKGFELFTKHFHSLWD